MSGTSWRPLRTQLKARLERGDLIAYEHAVWRVAKAEDLPLDEADREVWLQRGMPDPGTWVHRPYEVTLDWVGGAEPSWAADSGSRRGVIKVAAGKNVSWRIYLSERWPQCSCCGEPMPCRAELEDQQVAAGLDRIRHFEAIPPGACWACSEPITTRQKSITFSGENLDLPGGPQVQFHLRQRCRQSAYAYEERWVAVDPRRERTLSWPRCDGILVVHADGSSECVAGRSPLGADHESQPDCQGHLTHDHGIMRACYSVDAPLDLEGSGDGVCGRGCTRVGHPGTRTTPRPARREPSIGGLF